MHSRFILLFLVFLCHFSDSIRAQEYKVFSYNELDGMQNTLLKATAVDTYGLTWLATDGGLIRYDGRSFKSYKNEIPTPFIKDIIAVGDRLLASTDEGLYWVEPSLQSAIIRSAFPQQPLRLTKQLYQDRQGRIWGSNNNNVFCAEGKTLTVYPFRPEYHSEDFTLSFSFAEDGQGHLFTVSKNGVVFRYNEASNEFSDPLHQLPAGANAALQVDGGEIWVGTYSGIYQLCFNEQGGVDDVQQISSLSPIALLSLKDETIAAAVRNQGVFRVDRQGRTTSLQSERWPVTSFVSIGQGNGSDLWVGTDNGLLLLKPNFFDPLFPDQLGGRYIQSVVHFQGKTYISVGAQIFVVPTALDQSASLQPFFQPSFEVYTMAAAPSGLWMGGAGGKVFKLGWDGKVLRRHHLSDYGKEIFNMAVDQNDEVWICQARAAGLLRLQQNGEVSLYQNQGGRLAGKYRSRTL